MKAIRECSGTQVHLRGEILIITIYLYFYYNGLRIQITVHTYFF